MPAPVTEQLDPQALEPFFAEIEPVRQDINVIRGLVASIGQERHVRLRQITPVNRIEIGSDTFTVDETRRLYIVDGMRPLRKARSPRFVTAVWAPKPGGLELNEQGSKMQHFEPGELDEDNKDPEELFKEYDQRTVGNYLSSGKLRGWFDPDIHTAQGMRELLVILKDNHETG